MARQPHRECDLFPFQVLDRMNILNRDYSIATIGDIDGHYRSERNTVGAQHNHGIQRQGNSIQTSGRYGSTPLYITFNSLELDINIVFGEESFFFGDVKRPISNPGHESNFQRDPWRNA